MDEDWAGSGFDLGDYPLGAIQEGIQHVQTNPQEPCPSMSQVQTDIPLSIHHSTQMPGPDPNSPGHHVHALEHSPIRKG